ncbi:PREDICTED: uncharacterized protein LOC109587386 [Amphimedon queenslandica]|uniref:Uncharacterized protein n=2 Tax=Amphimedon queenslandica TaxID=400682 RepID=A0AAN0JQS1_AMPQE|nr:PREDICTED: uncharacterized protein LOC109587386 [Amphimedon queenslandica]|eukprot:XP_019859182.1 PREDICTED: uncharacterized protein LOC109587386 [Amphimedon queenslandica]
MCYGQTGKYWERINEEEMGIKVITAVQSDAVKRLRVKKNPSKPLRQIDQHLDGKASKPKSQNESVKNSQPMDDDPLSSAVTSNTPVTIEFSNEKDAFVRVRKFYQKCKKYQKEGTSFCGRRWLYFIDSGGQIQFQKLLPAFMPYASVLLLVVSLSKDLNEPSSTAMQLSERKINVSERSLSVIEILKQLLSAIASSTQRYRSLIADDPLLSELITPPSDKLKVLPVATHPDEYEEALKKGKESSDDKRKKINEIAHRHESCEIVGHEGRIYLYKVDGSKARNKVFEDLQPDSDLYKIAQALEKNHYKIKVPLKWYCFGVLLHDVAKEGCGVLSLSYCQELGQQLEVNLSADKSLSAIKFLSFLNKLLFYPDSPAGDLVFVNIESLFNILKDLLVFVCDAHSDAKFLLSDQKALVCKGHLSIEILKKASKSCNKISKAFSDFETKLLGLFEYLLIATKLPEKDTFFMPALLPIKDVSDINPYPNTIPLLFYFENAIPMGLFCAVIVHLLSEKEASWKVIEESNFSNYFTLQCPDLLESIIILVEQVDCIALYCEAEDDYIPAREAMEEAVDAAMLAHKLSEKPKKAFYCPCGKGRHVAVVSWLKKQRRHVFHCTINHKSQKMPDCLNWLDQTSKRKRRHDELQHLPDVLESNIAYQVLVESTEEIKEYFSDDFSEIASKLLQMNLITERERSAITDTNTGRNKYQRMEELIEHVKVAVKIKESVFFLLLDIFNEKEYSTCYRFCSKTQSKI